MEEKKYSYKYPHPAVTTDCVIFGFDGTKLHILLIERGIEPYKGKWAFPGGFLNIDESCEEGALRELHEETGLTGVYIEQFHTFSEPKRDPRERVITVAYYALVRIQDVKAGDDATNARWFALDNIPQLAFDHDQLLREALKSLRERIHFEPVCFSVLPEKFTMQQLQNLYEAIFGTEFNSNDFAKKILDINILTLTDCSAVTAHDRETRLYSFNKDSYDALKRNGVSLIF